MAASVPSFKFRSPPVALQAGVQGLGARSKQCSTRARARSRARGTRPSLGDTTRTMPPPAEIRDHRESDHEAARKKLEPRAAPVKESPRLLLRQQPAWPRASGPGPTPTQAVWGRHRAGHGRVSRWGERPLEVRQRRSVEARHCDAGASFKLLLDQLRVLDLGWLGLLCRAAKR